MKKDILYQEKEGPTPFCFNKSVSSVFEDMLSRSIPGYWDQQDFIARFVLEHLSDKGCLLDFGASLGASVIHVSKLASKSKRSLNKNKAVLCDLSDSMLENCKKNVQSVESQWGSMGFQRMDLRDKTALEAFFRARSDTLEVMILHYVLQFLPLKDRKDILHILCSRLAKGGVLLVGEKVVSSLDSVQRVWQKSHTEYKLANHYSLEEIQKKEEALKGVLVPMTEEGLATMLGEIKGVRWSLYYSFAAFKCYALVKQ